MLCQECPRLRICMFELKDEFFDGEEWYFPFLSDLQNKCLNYVYLDGFTYNEVAMRVNRRVNIVRKRIYSGKQQIGNFCLENCRYISKGGINANL